jgi:GntR family transcriptional regulator
MFSMTQDKKTILLDRGPTPLYFQLKNILEAKILSQEFKEHERLPTEAELCEQFGVSRATILRALEELLKVGLIYRDRGRGTFVTQGARLMDPVLKGSIQDLITVGKGSRLKVLSYKEILVPQGLSDTLQVGESEKVFRLECVRFTPEGPQAYSLMYFPPDLGRAVSLDELTETTEIISFVEEKLRHKAYRANQTIDVGVADRLLAKHLDIKPKTALLVIQRDYYTRKGSLMYVGKSYFRPDRFRYEIELTRT